tara:strand:- start:8140 stop:8772 length:633 start_codon:yes stop_codon:yes gene_type:complete
MRNLGITQRVENVETHSERRDSLDQKWSVLANEMGFVPIPLPNSNKEIIPKMIKTLKLDAIILSGGNSISYLDYSGIDVAPERDAFELALIKEAINLKVPILGVCRGMQMINIFFKGKISPVKGHVNTRHDLNVDSEYTDLILNNVNSFHNWGIHATDVGSNLLPIAKDNMSNVEAFIHESHSIAGIMWHPERDIPFKQKDMKLIKKFLL